MRLLHVLAVLACLQAGAQHNTAHIFFSDLLGVCLVKVYILYKKCLYVFKNIQVGIRPDRRAGGMLDISARK